MVVQELVERMVHQERQELAEQQVHQELLELKEIMVEIVYNGV